MTPRTKTITFATIAVLIGWVASLMAVSWGAGGEATKYRNAVEANTKVTVDHEARLRVLESQVSTIAADVGWIKDAVARIERAINPPKPLQPSEASFTAWPWAREPPP